MNYTDLRHRVPYFRSLDEIIGMPELTLPLDPNNDVYLMAQQATWLDATHFAVGRWNGVVTIFDSETVPPTSPVLETAVAPPAHGGVQMLAAGDGTWFASSNDGQSITVWTTADGTWADTSQVATFTYDAAYGVANCGYYTMPASGALLVTGHESGWLLIWDAQVMSQLSLIGAVDLTNANPTNPWGLQNIRGITPVDMGAGQVTIATGSENGDICLVNVPAGVIITRRSYNPTAQRGINTIAAAPPLLLVGNCAVGPADKNLWAFDISQPQIEPIDSVNLVIDTTLPQVFDFSISWATANNVPTWFAATQEGAVWGGTITNNTIQVIGYDEVSAQVGAATCFGGANELIVAAYNVHSFTVT